MRIQLKIILIYCFLFTNNFYSSAKSNEGRDFIKASTPQKFLNELEPIKQKYFLKNLEEFAMSYSRSKNAIQKFLLRKKRKKFISEHLKNLSFEEWIGRIKKIQTTENGEASLEIELPRRNTKSLEKSDSNIEFNLTVGTNINRKKDEKYKTLINPDTPIYNWLADFQEGEWVIFSGNSFLAEMDYLKISSLNEQQAMITPKFLVKFEFIEKIDIYDSNEDNEANKNISKINKNNKKLLDKNIINSKTITIRYFKNFRLSNYNWNYKNFINRWHRMISYHWNNHPPIDYLEGSNPKGGEVFVLAIVKEDGRVTNYRVNSFGEVSKNMEISALEAVRVVSLPPIPEDFPDEELKVEFRFELSQIPHLFKEKNNQMKNLMKKADNNSDDQKGVFSKMGEKILIKKLISSTRVAFNQSIKQELSSHFSPNQRFDPSLKLEIELALNGVGKIIEKKIIAPVKSEKFLLMIMNSLRKSNFSPLPKILASNAPYRVLLRIIP